MAANVQGIAEDLCLESKQVGALDNDIIIVVSDEWLFSLLRYGVVPSKGSVRTSLDTLPPDVFYGKIESPWKKLTAQVISKPEDGSILKLPKIPADMLLKQDLDFLEFLQCVAKQNYESNWRQAYHKYGTLELTQNDKRVSPKVELVDLKDVLQTLYQCPIIQAKGNRNYLQAASQVATSSPHPNITPAVCVIESKKAFYLLQHHMEHSLHDCVTFSPAMLGQSYAKPLFVVYQLLQAMQHCHQIGVPCGDVSLRDFSMNAKLWITMRGPKWETLFKCANKSNDTSDPVLSVECKKMEQSKVIDEEIADGEGEEDQLKQWKLEKLPELVMEWVTGKLSNYDYLMILNHLAGRRKCIPNYQPVLPWVMDFTRPDGGYRDLTKSKYRLNKGDRQLDLTYEAALNMAVSSFGGATDSPAHIPHHISDVLSEITYYVYNARRTPKSVLCNHVRANWVPGEYPANMQRMQEWTPDECIPEFFSDPDIFVSLHEDLPDLEVPSWCSGPEDFIKKHRAVLESDLVSEKLHRWIDLTFGYKLSGSAAIKAKNVCLHLVDLHTNPTSHGVVQLFNVPHPRRVSRSYYMGPIPPVIKPKRAQAYDSVEVTKTLEPEKDEVRTTEANLIATGLVASVTGAMGSELAEPSNMTQGGKADSTSATGSEGQVSDPHTEATTDLKASDSSLEANQNGRTLATTTEPTSATLPTSVNEDTLTQQTKNPIKKFPFFRSRGEAVESKPSIPRPEEQTIMLPEDYDPLASLNHLESFYTFSSRALQGMPVATAKVKQVDVCYECLTNDIRALGCTIAELFLAPKIRMQNPKASLEERYITLQRVMSTDYQDLPRPIKRVIEVLLEESNGKKSSLDLHSESSLPMLTPHLLLQPFADIIPFPKYFATLYQFLSDLHSSNSSVDRVFIDGLSHRRQAMEKVQIASKWVPQILRIIKPEGKDVLLLYLVDLFSDSDTALYASLLILNKVMQYYGPEASRKSLLQPLMKTYDSDFTSPNAVLLFHRSFVSQLMVRFGLKVFLKHLLEYIVNATAGVKYCPMFDQTADDPIGVMPETGRSRYFSVAQDAFDFFGKSGSYPRRSFIHNHVSEKLEDAETRQVDSPRLEVTQVSSDNDDDDNDDDDDIDEVLVDESDLRKDQSTSGDSSSLDTMSFNEDRRGSQNDDTSGSNTDSREAPGDMTGETNGKREDISGKPCDTNGKTDDTDGRIECNNLQTETSDETHASKDAEDTTNNVQDDTNSLDITEEDASPIPTKVHSAHDTTTESDSLPFIPSVEVSVSSLLDLSPGSTMVNIAVETVMWLVHRLGPALTATFLSSKLLRTLAQCYLGREQLTNCEDDSDSESSDDEYGVSIERKTVQGDINSKAVLGCLTDIALLYGDQFIFQQYFPFMHETVKSVKKVNSKTESSLVACIVLLKHLLPYLKDTQLMDNLKMIFRKILQPLINIVSASHLSFPTGGLARAVIAFKLVDVITTVALRIGREMTREHMTGLLQQFFVCFEQVHGENCPSGNFSPDYDRNTSCYSTDSEEMYCEIKVDSGSNQYKVGTPTKLEYLKGEFGDEMARSPFGSALSPKLSGDNLDQLEDGKWCDPSIMAELQQAFTPELAHTAYIPLCRLTGSIHMESNLYNHELVWKLSNTHEKELAAQRAAAASLTQQGGGLNQDDASRRQTSWFVDIGASVPAAKLEVDDDPLHVSSGEFGKNVALVGNRIDISGCRDSESSTDDEADGETLSRQRSQGTSRARTEKKENPSSQMGKSIRQLKGNWLSYWEQFTAKGELDDVYQFTQLKLQSFVGHTAGIRALCTMGNENSFVSSSKDKMVKLWSLRNQGNGSHKSQCRYTYPYHRKTVFAATFLEAPRLVATCDGVIHVWDPFTGAVVRQYDLTRGSPNLLIKLPAPSPMLIAGMADATVRFIDTRLHSVQHEFKVASGPLGLIRCLAVSPDGNTLGVGLSSGVLSMVDLRTGLLLGGWRAHEGEVLQIKSCSNNTFVTTSVDHSIAMWKEDGQRVCTFRGANEPVHCLHLSNGQIVSATTSNRIGIHSSLDHTAGYYSTRVRSDVLKGVISAMEVLPLNKLLLLGSDNGTITLLA